MSILVFILYSLLKSTCARLGDFPKPDFIKTIKLSNRGPNSHAEVAHNFGVIPFNVRVYASTKDGDNAGFQFEGTGVSQNDGVNIGPFGGVLFAYNKETIRLWAPSTTMGQLIFVGQGWGNNKNSQSSMEAEVTIEAWKYGPAPSFEIELEIDSRDKEKVLFHDLQQIPEFISIQISNKNEALDDAYIFHAGGASQTPSKVKSYGGVLFAYNEKLVKLWTPNKSKRAGCIAVPKAWGNGKNSIPIGVRICRVQIRLWINSFPLPIFQTSWKTFFANQHAKSFIEINHKLRIMPSYVKVQYRINNKSDSLIFEGSGSVQSSVSSNTKYGGIVFAINELKVRMWLPSSAKQGQAFVVFIGDGWGVKGINVASVSADVRVLIYADKCIGNNVIDAQGICRNIQETHLIQTMGPWEECSNSCGKGITTRFLKGCSGQRLKEVMSCNFATDLCGFSEEPKDFPWVRTTGRRKGQNDISLYGIPKGSYFVYTDTSKAVPGQRGYFTSPKLGKAEGCILTFKYSSGPYFGTIQVDTMTIAGKWKKEVWYMKDAELRGPNVWMDGYLNVGEQVGSIQRFRFVQIIDYLYKCPAECNAISISNIVLKCEKPDQFVLSPKQCKDKEVSLPSCLMDVFKPFARGPAYSVNFPKNADNKTVGMFVSSLGWKGDFIASHKFQVPKKGRYVIWVDAFALSFKHNTFTIQVNDYPKSVASVVFNSYSALWVPVKEIYTTAGIFFIKLYQDSRGFSYKNITVAPKDLDVWSSLGMQNHQITDNSFLAVGGVDYYMVFSRLNGKTAWMPTDRSYGKIFLQVTLPDLALINKIATQGGTRPEWVNNYSGVSKFRIKSSLDGKKDFAYYRRNINDKFPYEFPGNDLVPDKISIKSFQYALLARGIRVYPLGIVGSFLALRLELYGFYIKKGLCPHLLSKVKEKSCVGNGDCGYANAKCQLNKVDNRTLCTCIKGYHGHHCKMAGCEPNPCQNDGFCTGNKEKFSCDCPVGYYGKYCQQKCPLNKYGKNCLLNCKCEGKEYCNPFNGSCSCFRGYYGMKCDRKCSSNTFGDNCKSKCHCKTFMKCDHIDGKCYCKEGFFGTDCKSNCSHDYFGRNCTEKCTCINGTCNRNNGKCDCFPGYLGDSCQASCPDNRFGKGCGHYCHNPPNSTCDHVTGLFTCVNGLTGRFCNKPCKEGQYGINCKQTCRCHSSHTESCDRQTGKCNCKPSYEGKSCSKPCTDSWGMNCNNKCECANGATCDIHTGKCTCLDGYIGTHCNETCPRFFYGAACSKKCSCHEMNTEFCEPENGFCVCHSGYHGPNCTKLCDRDHYGRNCMEICKCYNGDCDHRDGFCTCKPGFEGLYCAKQCSTGYGLNCAKECLCQNNARCNRMNGHCDCQLGYKGKYCEVECPEGTYGLNCSQKCNCVLNGTSSCHHIDGFCECSTGFQGSKCEQVCDDGFFGNNCEESCFSCRHATYPCNKHTGHCQCNDGFSGKHCQDDCDWIHSGQQCQQNCHCNNQQLCNNINGKCYEKKDFIFDIKFLTSSNIFTNSEAKQLFKQNFEMLMERCFMNLTQLLQSSNQNTSKTTSCSSVDNNLNDDLETYDFVARIVNIKGMLTTDDKDVTVITLTLLHNAHPVNGSFIQNILTFIDMHDLSISLNHNYYIGNVIPKKDEKAWHEGSMKWVVIGVGAFGVLLLLFVIVIIVRCTRKVRHPSPFQKIKGDAKDIELLPCLATSNSHVLAFDNPYYDVIAAMGLDDDIEEDYFNPLYDHIFDSDSETEPEDMYFYGNHQYRRGNLHPFDKDSGFSSGTLISV